MTDSLRTTLDTVWSTLEAHVFDQGANRTYATLATFDPERGPQLRHVSLRAAQRAPGEADVYTDLRSHKVAEITADPRVSLLIWQPQARVQLRLTGNATVVSGPQTRPLWDALPPDGRLNYAHEPAPGTPLPRGDAFSFVPDPANFAVIRVKLDHIDYVSLAETGHRRAAFLRSDGWKGQWLSP